MTNKEAIEQIESLADHCSSMQDDPEDIWEKDIQALDTATKAIKENEKLKVALFGAIRNRTVMPVGLKKGKSMQEINRMAYLTMQQLLEGDIIDWDRMGASYEEGKKLAQQEDRESVEE